MEGWGPGQVMICLGLGHLGLKWCIPLVLLLGGLGAMSGAGLKTLRLRNRSKANPALEYEQSLA